MQASNFSSIAIFLLLAIIITPSTCENIIFPKTSYYISVNSGAYTVSFVSNCVLILGYTKNKEDLYRLPTSIPSTFTVVNKSATYSAPSLFSLDDKYYFALFNPGENYCYYVFSTSLYVRTVDAYSDTPIHLPYGVTITIKTSASQKYVKVQSTSRTFIRVEYSSESSDSKPVNTPYILTNIKSIYYDTNMYIEVQSSNYANTYIYLKCQTVGGCHVKLSTTNHKEEDAVRKNGISTTITLVIGVIGLSYCIGFILLSITCSIFYLIRNRLLEKARTESLEKTAFISEQPTVYYDSKNSSSLNSI